MSEQLATEQNVKCVLCSAPKAPFECEVCHIHVCKKCSESIGEGEFSFYSKVPDVLKLKNFCVQCYDAQVLPQKLIYDDLLEKAKNTYYLTVNNRSYVRILGKHTKRVEAGPCTDRRECIVQLAFRAVENGFNAIIEGDVTSIKVRNEAYQHSLWKGSGMPANIDGVALERTSARGL